MSGPALFRKAHPDQKIVRLDLPPEQIARAAALIRDLAGVRRGKAMLLDADILVHIASRLEQAQ